MTKPACQPFLLRIIDGELPAQAPDLAVHVGGCLDCYRALTELRDVPRLAAALRADLPAEPDPSLFERLPDLVWAATRSPPPAPTTPGLWLRLAGLLSRPLPAALAGGLCAAVLMLAAHRPVAPVHVALPPDTVLADEELPPSDLGELGAADLAAMLARGADHGDGDEAEVESFVRAVNDDGASAIEGVVQMDADELRAVDQALASKPI